MSSEYDYLIALLKSGDIAKLEEAADVVDHFPDGCDDFSGSHWVINAIDQGCLASIEWMLNKGVDLSFRGDDGYTPLLSAIDRAGADRNPLEEARALGWQASVAYLESIEE